MNAAVRLFAERGYEPTSVEQIAGAAGVSHRTFYRYFRSKEDVLFSDPKAEAVVRTEMRVTRAGESDAERMSRALLAAMRASETRIVQVRKVLESAPALRGRALEMLTGSVEVLVQELLDRRRRTASELLRARVLAAAVSVAMRVAYFAWLDSGRRGDPGRACSRSLEVLREGFDRPRKA